MTGIYANQYKDTSGLEFLEKAAELTSFDTIIADHLGDAYKRANQSQKAVDTYEKAIANAREDQKDLVTELKKKIKAVQQK